jgi:hypothetical protein
MAACVKETSIILSGIILHTKLRELYQFYTLDIISDSISETSSIEIYYHTHLKTNYAVNMNFNSQLLFSKQILSAETLILLFCSCHLWE